MNRHGAWRWLCLFYINSHLNGVNAPQEPELRKINDSFISTNHLLGFFFPVAYSSSFLTGAKGGFIDVCVVNTAKSQTPILKINRWLSTTLLICGQLSYNLFSSLRVVQKSFWEKTLRICHFGTTQWQAPKPPAAVYCHIYMKVVVES